MCEIIIILFFLTLVCGCKPVGELFVSIFGGFLLIIIATFILFFFFVLLIEQPVLALIILAAVIFAVYLVNQHRREMKKRAAEIEIEMENKKIESYRQYMSDYFERRKRILKKFDHFD